MHSWVFQKARIAFALRAHAILILSEKPTRANKFQIERDKSYNFLLIIHTKTFWRRTTRAFCHVMNHAFMQPLIIYKLFSCQSSVGSSKQIYKQQSSETQGGKCLQVFFAICILLSIFTLCLAIFCTLLRKDCTAFNQSESRNFYIIVYY